MNVRIGKLDHGWAAGWMIREPARTASAVPLT